MRVGSKDNDSSFFLPFLHVKHAFINNIVFISCTYIPPFVMKEAGAYVILCCFVAGSCEAVTLTPESEDLFGGQGTFAQPAWPLRWPFQWIPCRIALIRKFFILANDKKGIQLAHYEEALYKFSSFS